MPVSHRQCYETVEFRRVGVGDVNIIELATTQESRLLLTENLKTEYILNI